MACRCPRDAARVGPGSSRASLVRVHRDLMPHLEHTERTLNQIRQPLGPKMMRVTTTPTARDSLRHVEGSLDLDVGMPAGFRCKEWACR
jgi:hypothetical protein